MFVKNQPCLAQWLEKNFALFATHVFVTLWIESHLSAGKNNKK